MPRKKLQPITTNPEGPLAGWPKPKDKAKRRKRQEKPWLGRFLAVDGEGWDGKYTLLQMTGQEDLYDPQGLSTADILYYLTLEGRYKKTGKNAIVGYGLSYDFENWLRDLTDEQYTDLVVDGLEVEFGPWTISYIPRKMLRIRLEDGERGKYYHVMDALGFFQDSFIGALEKWKIPVPDIIRKGKAMREEFSAEDVEWVKQYNHWELIKLCELMEALRIADEEAWRSVGLLPRHGPHIWYGPGSRAANLLDQTHWQDEHPALLVPDTVPSFVRESLVPLHLIKMEAGKLLERFAADQEGRRDIVAELQALGGVRAPDRHSRFRTEWRERIPISTRRRIVSRSGLALDEAAEALGMSAGELLQRLEEWTPQISARAEDFWDAARRELASRDDPSVYEHMFAAAYYGGRIETAYVGEFDGPIYSYDINSAYPYAICHLPKWSAEDLIWVDGLDELDRMGMYYVRWRLPEGANFYPFPYRRKNGNVFYPPAGEGWYMSPEVYAALRHWPQVSGHPDFGLDEYGIYVVGGLVLQHTDGAGDGICYPMFRCTTADKLEEMARVRLEAKRRGATFEKALKLVLNSVYGKTIQQVGSHRYLCTFASSWITSTCRALIYRAIGPDQDKRVIGIMTDGIYSTAPLDVKEGPWLGEWEQTVYDDALFLLPGVYRLRRGGKEKRKYRGVSKDIDYDAALSAWRQGEKYPVSVRLFVSRNLALRQPEAFGDKVYRFVDYTREEEFSLASKRDTEGVDRCQRAAWHPPKRATEGVPSTPYLLDLEPSELDYDQADTPEELTSKGLYSAMMDEIIFSEGAEQG